MSVATIVCYRSSWFKKNGMRINIYIYTTQVFNLNMESDGSVDRTLFLNPLTGLSEISRQQ